MQEWIGHIAAALIGGTILLILAVIGWRGQHHSTSATQYTAAKGRMLDIVQVLEEDLSNMGAGLTNNTINEEGAAAAADIYAGAFYTDEGNPFDTTSATRTIRFCSWTSRSTSFADPTLDTCDRVRYEWKEVGTAQVRTTSGTYASVPTYQIERFVNGTKNGESADVYTQVRFDLFDSSGAVEVNPSPSSNLKNVRAVRVSLRAVSPLGGGEGYTSDEDPALRYQVDQTRWSRMIRPLNLARVSN